MRQSVMILVCIKTCLTPTVPMIVATIVFRSELETQ